jgi:hypothetical protein
MGILAAIGFPILVGIILFFVLPALEKPRQKFLSWLGIKSKDETRRSEELLQARPASESILPPPAEEAEQVLPSDLPGIPLADPNELIEDIESRAFMQQPDVAKHYLGMRINCIGEVARIDPPENDEVRFYVWRRGTHGRGAGLIFNVNKMLYPGLGILKNSDPIRVSGIIEKVSIPNIYLRDVKLIGYGKTFTPAK